MGRTRVEVEATAVRVRRPDDPDGRVTDGLRLECTECGQVCRVAGTGRGSFRYGYILLRNKCPTGGQFYVSEDEPEDDT